MNIKQIRYFVAVVDHGSLSAAAKNQHVTVQAVSKATSDLERELGQMLFVRESRGVRPTPFGTAFFQRALPVLHGFDELETFAKSYRESQLHVRLRLALCTPPFYRNEQACMRIAAFIRRGLNIDASVVLSSGKDGLESLLAGDLDALIIIGTLAHPQIECVSLGTMASGVLMSKTHPLASRKVVDVADLRKFPVQAPDAFDTFSDVVAPAYRARGVDVQRVRSSSEQLNAYLNDKQGLVLVAGISVLGELHRGAETRLIASDDAVPIPVYLASLKNDKPAPLQAFEHWLINELALFGGPTGEHAH